MNNSVEGSDFSVKPLVEVLFFLLLSTYMVNLVFHIGINLYLSDIIVVAIMALTIIQLLGKNHLHRYRRFIILFALLFLYYLIIINLSHNTGRFSNLFLQSSRKTDNYFLAYDCIPGSINIHPQWLPGS